MQAVLSKDCITKDQFLM